MSRFADRFTPTQRAALAALGYTLLQRSHVGAAVGREPPLHEATPAIADGPDVRQARGAEADQPAHPRNDRSRPTAAPTREVPVELRVRGLDGSALARGILAAADAVDDQRGRVHHAGDTLAVDLGGTAAPWTVDLDQLRRSPKHKAALWRALRMLARSPA